MKILKLFDFYGDLVVQVGKNFYTLATDDSYNRFFLSNQTEYLESNKRGRPGVFRRKLTVFNHIPVTKNELPLYLTKKYKSKKFLRFFQ